MKVPYWVGVKKRKLAKGVECVCTGACKQEIALVCTLQHSTRRKRALLQRA